MAPPANQKSSNGFAIKSWGDVVAVSTLFALFLSVVAWGLKLENDRDALELRIAQLERQVGNGVLPRADERINDLRRDFDRLEEYCRAR